MIGWVEGARPSASSHPARGRLAGERLVPRFLKLRPAESTGRGFLSAEPEPSRNFGGETVADLYNLVVLPGTVARHSLAPAAPVMQSTVFRWVAWLLVIAVAVFTLSPIELRPTTPAPANLERFVAFAIVGGAFWLGYPNRRIGSVLLVIGIAGLLEILQHVVPGRHGEPQDFAVKAFGSAFGAFCALFSAWVVNGGRTAQRPLGDSSELDTAPEQDTAEPMGEIRPR